MKHLGEDPPGSLIHHHHLGEDSQRQVSFDINENEYGLTGIGKKTIDIHFHPSEYGILDNYSVIKEIYKVQLSPTIISLTTHKETNLVRETLITFD